MTFAEAVIVVAHRRSCTDEAVIDAAETILRATTRDETLKTLSRHVLAEMRERLWLKDTKIEPVYH
jgi:hypothetical protein